MHTYLTQAGRFRRDLCTCHGDRPLAIDRELPTTDRREADFNHVGGIGMPPLMLADEELAQRSPHDLQLYGLLYRTFKQRVRELEVAVKARVWECKVHRISAKVSN